MASPGVVKSWNLAKGFGFVEADGKTVFVHQSDLDGGTLVVGRPVVVEIEDSTRRRGQFVGRTVTGEGVQPRPASAGVHTGVVKAWNVANSLGFIDAEDGGEVYVHASAFGGGNLEVGKLVTFDLEDVHHKSQRKVAVNVDGPAVLGIGARSGKVKWFNKGYGFIETTDEAGEKEDIFVHGSQLSGGSLAADKAVYFDIKEDMQADGSVRRLAVNISGPCVCKPDIIAKILRGKGGRGGGRGGRGGGKGYKGYAAEGKGSK